jgi:cell division inhibitor SulA
MSRSATISALFRRNRWSFSVVPFLRLSGRWLSEAGFPTGCKVQVHVEAGSITIRPADGSASML